MKYALRYAEEQFDTFADQLEELLRIPTISTDSQYKKEVQRGAEWLANHMQSIGLENARPMETGGHPIVFAEHHVSDDLPTVLVYGHYDVQPPDPLELWDTPPFEPTRKNGSIYARGACDDKGQMFMHVKAAEAYLQEGDPPVNLKFLIEGEEETGSKHLAPFIEENKDLLDADVILVSDTSMFASNVPTIMYGLRGLAYVEVTLTGPSRDLHSGHYGGAVENPVLALAELLNGIHDEDHHVTVPGFYDDARPVEESEREAYRKLPFDANAWKEEIGLKKAKTERGYSILEATTLRPAVDVNGIWGGYTGEGAKTVLPSKASAKISARIVPDQTPSDIAQKLRRYFEERVPDTMTLTFNELHGGHPVRIDPEHPAMQAARNALRDVFDREASLVRGGGSIPILADFKRILGLDTILMGFGLESDAIHSPNENFGLDRFQQGIRSIIRFHKHFAEQQSA